MKTIQLWSCLVLLSIASTTFAQQDYTVQGKTYSLNTEVEGTLTLLWNIIDEEYRYFIKKGNTIQELTNTKKDGKYQFEYRNTLQSLTNDADIAVHKVNLTLPSISKFAKNYNRIVDPNFKEEVKPLQVGLRLGAFAGLTNRSVINNNPDNAIIPAIGAELEVIDNIKLLRHSLVLRLAQTFASSDYEYTGTAFSLNYRYKFIKKNTIDVYVNLKGVTYTFFDTEITTTVENIAVTNNVNDNEFNFPGTFGLGADIALGKGFLTLNYDDIVALNRKTNGEFPVNFTVGYKIGL